MDLEESKMRWNCHGDDNDGLLSSLVSLQERSYDSSGESRRIELFLRLLERLNGAPFFYSLSHIHAVRRERRHRAQREMSPVRHSRKTKDCSTDRREEIVIPCTSMTVHVSPSTSSSSLSCTASSLLVSSLRGKNNPVDKTGCSDICPSSRKQLSSSSMSTNFFLSVPSPFLVNSQDPTKAKTLPSPGHAPITPECISCTSLEKNTPSLFPVDSFVDSSRLGHSSRKFSAFYHHQSSPFSFSSPFPPPSAIVGRSLWQGLQQLRKHVQSPTVSSHSAAPPASSRENTNEESKKKRARILPASVSETSDGRRQVPSALSASQPNEPEAVERRENERSWRENGDAPRLPSTETDFFPPKTDLLERERQVEMSRPDALSLSTVGTTRGEEADQRLLSAGHSHIAVFCDERKKREKFSRGLTSEKDVTSVETTKENIVAAGRLDSSSVGEGADNARKPGEVAMSKRQRRKERRRQAAQAIAESLTGEKGLQDEVAYECFREAMDDNQEEGTGKGGYTRSLGQMQRPPPVSFSLIRVEQPLEEEGQGPFSGDERLPKREILDRAEGQEGENERKALFIEEGEDEIEKTEKNTVSQPHETADASTIQTEEAGEGREDFKCREVTEEKKKEKEGEEGRHSVVDPVDVGENGSYACSLGREMRPMKIEEMTMKKKEQKEKKEGENREREKGVCMEEKAEGLNHSESCQSQEEPFCHQHRQPKVQKRNTKIVDISLKQKLTEDDIYSAISPLQFLLRRGMSLLELTLYYDPRTKDERPNDARRKTGKEEDNEDSMRGRRGRGRTSSRSVEGSEETSCRNNFLASRDDFNDTFRVKEEEGAIRRLQDRGGGDERQPVKDLEHADRLDVLAEDHATLQSSSLCKVKMQEDGVAVVPGTRCMECSFLSPPRYHEGSPLEVSCTSSSALSSDVQQSLSTPVYHAATEILPLVKETRQHLLRMGLPKFFDLHLPLLASVLLCLHSHTKRTLSKEEGGTREFFSARFFPSRPHLHHVAHLREKDMSVSMKSCNKIDEGQGDDVAPGEKKESNMVFNHEKKNEDSQQLKEKKKKTKKDRGEGEQETIKKVKDEEDVQRSSYEGKNGSRNEVVFSAEESVENILKVSAEAIKETPADRGFLARKLTECQRAIAEEAETVKKDVRDDNEERRKADTLVHEKELRLDKSAKIMEEEARRSLYTREEDILSLTRAAVFQAEVLRPIVLSSSAVSLSSSRRLALRLHVALELVTALHQCMNLSTRYAEGGTDIPAMKMTRENTTTKPEMESHNHSKGGERKKWLVEESVENEGGTVPAVEQVLEERKKENNLSENTMLRQTDDHAIRRTQRHETDKDEEVDKEENRQIAYEPESNLSWVDHNSPSVIEKEKDEIQVSDSSSFSPPTCSLSSLSHVNVSSFPILPSSLPFQASPSSENVRGDCGACIEVVAVEKLNGENAQISFSSTLGKWCVCSKNVCLVLSSTSNGKNCRRRGKSGNACMDKFSIFQSPSGRLTASAGDSSFPCSKARTGEKKSSESDLEENSTLASADEERKIKRDKSSLRESEAESSDEARRRRKGEGRAGNKERGEEIKTRERQGKTKEMNDKKEEEVQDDSEQTDDDDDDDLRGKKKEARYQHALKVARAWRRLIRNLSETQVLDLQVFLANHTLIGELVGCSEKQHFVRYDEFVSREIYASAEPPSSHQTRSSACWSQTVNEGVACHSPSSSSSPSVFFSSRQVIRQTDGKSFLIFYAIVPHDGLRLCLPPLRSLYLLKHRFHLPTARIYSSIRAYGAYELLMKLQHLVDSVFCQDVTLIDGGEEEERTTVGIAKGGGGEGVVLYFSGPCLRPCFSADLCASCSRGPVSTSAPDQFRFKSNKSTTVSSVDQIKNENVKETGEMNEQTKREKTQAELTERDMKRNTHDESHSHHLSIPHRNASSSCGVPPPYLPSPPQLPVAFSSSCCSSSKSSYDFCACSSDTWPSCVAFPLVLGLAKVKCFGYTIRRRIREKIRHLFTSFKILTLAPLLSQMLDARLPDRSDSSSSVLFSSAQQSRRRRRREKAKTGAEGLATCAFLERELLVCMQSTMNETERRKEPGTGSRKVPSIYTAPEMWGRRTDSYESGRNLLRDDSVGTSSRHTELLSEGHTEATLYRAQRRVREILERSFEGDRKKRGQEGRNISGKRYSWSDLARGSQRVEAALAVVVEDSESSRWNCPSFASFSACASPSFSCPTSPCSPLPTPSALPPLRSPGISDQVPPSSWSEVNPRPAEECRLNSAVLSFLQETLGLIPYQPQYYKALDLIRSCLLQSSPGVGCYGRVCPSSKDKHRQDQSRNRMRDAINVKDMTDRTDKTPPSSDSSPTAERKCLLKRRNGRDMIGKNHVEGGEDESIRSSSTSHRDETNEDCQQRDMKSVPSRLSSSSRHDGQSPQSKPPEQMRGRGEKPYHRNDDVVLDGSSSSWSSDPSEEPSKVVYELVKRLTGSYHDALAYATALATAVVLLQSPSDTSTQACFTSDVLTLAPTERGQSDGVYTRASQDKEDITVREYYRWGEGEILQSTLGELASFVDLKFLDFLDEATAFCEALRSRRHHRSQTLERPALVSSSSEEEEDKTEVPRKGQRVGSNSHQAPGVATLNDFSCSERQEESQEVGREEGLHEREVENEEEVHQKEKNFSRVDTNEAREQKTKRNQRKKDTTREESESMCVPPEDHNEETSVSFDSSPRSAFVKDSSLSSSSATLPRTKDDNGESSASSHFRPRLRERSEKSDSETDIKESSGCTGRSSAVPVICLVIPPLTLSVETYDLLSWACHERGCRLVLRHTLTESCSECRPMPPANHRRSDRISNAKRKGKSEAGSVGGGLGHDASLMHSKMKNDGEGEEGKQQEEQEEEAKKEDGSSPLSDKETLILEDAASRCDETALVKDKARVIEMSTTGGEKEKDSPVSHEVIPRERGKTKRSKFSSTTCEEKNEKGVERQCLRRDGKPSFDSSSSPYSKGSLLHSQEIAMCPRKNEGAPWKNSSSDDKNKRRIFPSSYRASAPCLSCCCGVRPSHLISDGNETPSFSSSSSSHADLVLIWGYTQPEPSVMPALGSWGECLECLSNLRILFEKILLSLEEGEEKDSEEVSQAMTKKGSSASESHEGRCESLGVSRDDLLHSEMRSEEEPYLEPPEERRHPWACPTDSYNSHAISLFLKTSSYRSEGKTEQRGQEKKRKGAFLIDLKDDGEKEVRDHERRGQQDTRKRSSTTSLSSSCEGHQPQASSRPLPSSSPQPNKVPSSSGDTRGKRDRSPSSPSPDSEVGSRDVEEKAEKNYHAALSPRDGKKRIRRLDREEERNSRGWDRKNPDRGGDGSFDCAFNSEKLKKLVITDATLQFFDLVTRSGVGNKERAFNSAVMLIRFWQRMLCHIAERERRTSPPSLSSSRYSCCSYGSSSSLLSEERNAWKSLPCDAVIPRSWKEQGTSQFRANLKAGSNQLQQQTERRSEVFPGSRSTGRKQDMASERMDSGMSWKMPSLSPPKLVFIDLPLPPQTPLSTFSAEEKPTKTESPGEQDGTSREGSSQDSGVTETERRGGFDSLRQLARANEGVRQFLRAIDSLSQANPPAGEENSPGSRVDSKARGGVVPEVTTSSTTTTAIPLGDGQFSGRDEARKTQGEPSQWYFSAVQDGADTQGSSSFTGTGGQEQQQRSPTAQGEKPSDGSPGNQKNQAGELRSSQKLGEAKGGQRRTQVKQEDSPLALITCILPVGFPGCGKSTTLMHFVQKAVRNCMQRRKERTQGCLGGEQKQHEDAEGGEQRPQQSHAERDRRLSDEREGEAAEQDAEGGEIAITVWAASSPRSTSTSGTSSRGRSSTEELESQGDDVVKPKMSAGSFSSICQIPSTLSQTASNSLKEAPLIQTEETVSSNAKSLKYLERNQPSACSPLPQESTTRENLSHIGEADIVFLVSSDEATGAALRRRGYQKNGPANTPFRRVVETLRGTWEGGSLSSAEGNPTIVGTSVADNMNRDRETGEKNADDEIPQHEFRHAAREGASSLSASIDRFFSQLTERLSKVLLATSKSKVDIGRHGSQTAAIHSEEADTTAPPSNRLERNAGQGPSGSTKMDELSTEGRGTHPSTSEEEKGIDRYSVVGDLLRIIQPPCTMQRRRKRRPLRICVLIDKNFPVDAIPRQAGTLQGHVATLNRVLSQVAASNRLQTEGSQEGFENRGPPGGTDQMDRERLFVKSAVCLMTLPPDARQDGSVRGRYLSASSLESPDFRPSTARPLAGLSYQWPFPWSLTTLCHCLRRVLIRSDHPTLPVKKALRREAEQTVLPSLSVALKGELTDSTCTTTAAALLCTSSGMASDGSLKGCDPQKMPRDYAQMEQPVQQKGACNLVNVFLSFVRLFRGQSLEKADLLRGIGEVDEVFEAHSVWLPCERVMKLGTQEVGKTAGWDFEPPKEPTKQETTVDKGVKVLSPSDSSNSSRALRTRCEEYLSSEVEEECASLIAAALHRMRPFDDNLSNTPLYERLVTLMSSRSVGQLDCSRTTNSNEDGRMSSFAGGRVSGSLGEKIVPAASSSSPVLGEYHTVATAPRSLSEGGNAGLLATISAERDLRRDVTDDRESSSGEPHARSSEGKGMISTLEKSRLLSIATELQTANEVAKQVEATFERLRLDSKYGSTFLQFGSQTVTAPYGPQFRNGRRLDQGQRRTPERARQARWEAPQGERGRANLTGGRDNGRVSDTQQRYPRHPNSCTTYDHRPAEPFRRLLPGRGSERPRGNGRIEGEEPVQLHNMGEVSSKGQSTRLEKTDDRHFPGLEGTHRFPGEALSHGLGAALVQDQSNPRRQDSWPQAEYFYAPSRPSGQQIQTKPPSPNLSEALENWTGDSREESTVVQLMLPIYYGVDVQQHGNLLFSLVSSALDDIVCHSRSKMLQSVAARFSQMVPGLRRVNGLHVTTYFLGGGAIATTRHQIAETEAALQKRVLRAQCQTSSAYSSYAVSPQYPPAQQLTGGAASGRPIEGRGQRLDNAVRTKECLWALLASKPVIGTAFNFAVTHIILFGEGLVVAAVRPLSPLLLLPNESDSFKSRSGSCTRTRSEPQLESFSPVGGVSPPLSADSTGIGQSHSFPPAGRASRGDSNGSPTSLSLSDGRWQQVNTASHRRDLAQQGSMAPRGGEPVSICTSSWVHVADRYQGERLPSSGQFKSEGQAPTGDAKHCRPVLPFGEKRYPHISLMLARHLKPQFSNVVAAATANALAQATQQRLLSSSVPELFQTGAGLLEGSYEVAESTDRDDLLFSSAEEERDERGGGRWIVLENLLVAGRRATTLVWCAPAGTQVAGNFTQR
ncbi:hypothetical protein CSUI_005134 [Cystoisospora suis]|uniref:Uncharacterized protein n=1 Tax=Cystoisospora suis TaxID=483139 RepID=A0A2C6KKL2_9APIC|nr:hypothetical protein CSUI_005134 [Cystoisospora suis]